VNDALIYIITTSHPVYGVESLGFAFALEDAKSIVHASLNSLSHLGFPEALCNWHQTGKLQWSGDTPEALYVIQAFAFTGYPVQLPIGG
jgi:hypothetical protein